VSGAGGLASRGVYAEATFAATNGAATAFAKAVDSHFAQVTLYRNGSLPASSTGLPRLSPRAQSAPPHRSHKHYAKLVPRHRLLPIRPLINHGISARQEFVYLPLYFASPRHQPMSALR
jgi:hypothetical protein